jgi:hypothetical protein
MVSVHRLSLGEYNPSLLEGKIPCSRRTYRAKIVVMLPAISIHLTSVCPSFSMGEPCDFPASNA